MKAYFKKAFAGFLALFMVSALIVPTFATNIGYNRGYNRNTAVYEYTVTFKDKGKDRGWEAITVVNTSNVPMEVHIGGVWRGCLNYKNSQLTVWYYKSSDKDLSKRVTVDPMRDGTHTFRIMSTGYKDTITRKS